MLADLLAERRSEILDRCLAKIRTIPSATNRPTEELINDLTQFLDQLITALQAIRAGATPSGLKTTGPVAAAHASQRWSIGFDLSQVIHDYGFLCDSITETADRAHANIEVAEYRILNQSLDTGIAEAVNEYVKRRDADSERQQGERVGFIAHELRNALTTSMMSFHAIRQAQLSLAGRTADALQRSLSRQRELIDHLINDVRLRSGVVKRVRIRLSELFDELEAATALHARSKSVRLSFATDPIEVEADKLLLTSVLMNLTLNAIKSPGTARKWRCAPGKKMAR